MKVKHVKEEDKIFECHICSTSFVMLSLLKGHIRRDHRNVHSHICELCAKEFKSKCAYELHYNNVHKISQKEQCEICGKWLKNKNSLKSHLITHKSKTEMCGVCGRVAKNIPALSRHMQRVHRVASFRCIICGKMFKKQHVLKEHMAIHTGTTDLYTCTFCTKTFRSSANMYSHRKKAPPRWSPRGRMARWQSTRVRAMLIATSIQHSTFNLINNFNGSNKLNQTYLFICFNQLVVHYP